jgi:hypothetical protein
MDNVQNPSNSVSYTIVRTGVPQLSCDRTLVFCGDVLVELYLHSLKPSLHNRKLYRYYKGRRYVPITFYKLTRLIIEIYSI